MPDLYPPPTSTVLELLRDYPHALEVGLFTNSVQTSAPIGLGDLSEAVFPGYQRWTGYQLELLYQQLDPEEMLVLAAPRWELQQEMAPLTVRGWFALAHLNNGAEALFAFGAFEAPVTIRQKGDVVLAHLWLTAQRALDGTGDVFLNSRDEVLVLTNGGKNVKFRGNDRKVVRNLKKAIEAVQRRDARWALRTSHSRMADQLVLTTGTPNYATLAGQLADHCTALMQLE